MNKTVLLPLWQKSPSQPGLHPKLQKPLKILQFLQVGWHFSEHSSPKNPYGHAVKKWKYILKKYMMKNNSQYSFHYL